MSCPEHQAARDVVTRALAEELGDRGDVTTDALVAADALAAGRIVTREAGVLAGTAAVEEAFRQVDPDVVVRWELPEGGRLEGGDVIAVVEGHLRSLLTAERTALNLLGRLSGVATATRRFVDRAGAATILDTRKTTPGLRVLEKAAVRAGGAANHRMGLYDAFLVKDNHLAHLTVGEAVKLARDASPRLLVEIECDTLAQVVEAVEAGADRVLLDNMTPDEVAEAVGVVRTSGRAGGDAARVEIEVSGRVTLDNVAVYAEAGPDFISVGSLTHSAPALDVSLEIA